MCWEKQQRKARGKIIEKDYSMKGGDGPHSYAQNSLYQKAAFEAAREIIKEEVAAKFDIKQCTLSTFHTFRVADLGCSTGSNSFHAVETIIQAVKEKIQSDKPNSKAPEFQVFFNDRVANDFNTLFASLPPEREYFATGVPGSFYSRLFPKASLHFVYSSCALNWLSNVPRNVLDESSTAWNEGRIHYMGALKDVFEAYAMQYANDMETFLHARAEEIVPGGMMALIIPGVPDVVLDSQATTNSEFMLLGSCLMDMANMGIIEKARLNSFNLPIYYPCPKELKELIGQNGCFTIERMEALYPRKHTAMPSLESRILYLRAVLDMLIENHFGKEIIDELFDRYSKKFLESSLFLDPDTHKSIMVFVLLKRSHDE